MAEQFYTILTAIGKAKIANTTALGTKVNLTKFQVGDGNGTYYNPTEDQTELKHKTWEGPISSIIVDENNPNWIVIQAMLPGDIGGFTIREAGVFDDENNLIAIGKYPETYKPIASDGSTKDLVIKMILEVSNASSVTLKVDPTVILATKKDIEILENKISNVRIPVTSVNTKTGNVVLKAKDIQCDDTHTIEQNIVELQDQFEALELTAEKVTITDTENNFTSGQVEGALKECITKATTALNKANEAFQEADNGKKLISETIGQPLSANDQFATMSTKIQSIKNALAENLIAKGQSANQYQNLYDLISKIKNINTSKYVVIEKTYPIDYINNQSKRRTFSIDYNVDFEVKEIFCCLNYYEIKHNSVAQIRNMICSLNLTSKMTNANEYVSMNFLNQHTLEIEANNYRNPGDWNGSSPHKITSLIFYIVG